MKTTKKLSITVVIIFCMAWSSKIKAQYSYSPCVDQVYSIKNIASSLVGKTIKCLLDDEALSFSRYNVSERHYMSWRYEYKFTTRKSVRGLATGWVTLDYKDCGTYLTSLTLEWDDKTYSIKDGTIPFSCLYRYFPTWDKETNAPAKPVRYNFVISPDSQIIKDRIKKRSK